MKNGFSATAAAFSFVKFAKAHPARSLQLLAWGMVPYFFFGLYQPVGALLAALSIVLLPTAWWRLFMGRPDGQTGFPLRLGHDEWRIVLAILPIHMLATLAVLPIHIGVVLFYSAAPSVLSTLAVANLTVIPVLVWARLGPSLPISVAERRYLVTRSWRPTGEIGWKLYVAWLPVMALLGLPLIWSTLQDQATPVIPEDLFWLVMLGVGMVMNFIMAMVCATQAYVARCIQERSAELPVPDPA